MDNLAEARRMVEEAAAVLRSRLVAVRQVTDAKTWMGSSTPGFVAHVIVVDVAQAARLQSAS